MTHALEQQLTAAQTRHGRHPDRLAPLEEICRCLEKLGREEEMLSWAGRALAISPSHPRFTTRYADALYLTGRYAEAAKVWQQHPDRLTRPRLHHIRLGMCRMMMGDLPHARFLLSKAYQMATEDDDGLAASAGFALGEAMLKAGDPQGFFHWRLRNDAPNASWSYAPQDIPSWDGHGDLSGKRVLVSHQLGFGDNFLLASCLHDWLEAGARIMLTCHPHSHALMQASLPGCAVISAPSPTQQHAPLPDPVRDKVAAFAPDIHATLLHLPLLTAKHRLMPGAWFAPYIRVPPGKAEQAERWAQSLRSQQPGKKLIGIFWDCVQRHWPSSGAMVRCWSQRRSLPLQAVNEIMADPVARRSCHFVNLHHPVAAKLAGVPAGEIGRYLPGIADFADTAACMSQLDSIIAVDSGVANLAAMIDVPTCVLTHPAGDWRWGTVGTHSPWLSNVSVFRQSEEGDWDPVVREVKRWLSTLAG